ncbi:MAG: tetratricopeptide repeat protein [Candidatus Latescibacteria bacterium]|nr:tetratricopeptide repeat protein [Candidatus Latescibacterota bacterium]MBT4138775.1 tetratricopeptide repeat protein [Candidatus Latescibacterota bacterium]MBT5829440.1 tetratricopeptide repeat protein [Candidatus Latescibacterota bacterium]
MQQGNVKRAAEICRQGLRYRPSYVAGHVVMGKCHLAVAHFEEARQEFQKVLQLDSDHPAALWHLGQIDLQLGWEDLALRHFELALMLDPLNKRLIEQITQLKGNASGVGSVQPVPDTVESVETKASMDEKEPLVANIANEDVGVLEDIESVGEEALSSFDNDTPAPELVVDENLSSLVSELAQDNKSAAEDTRDEIKKQPGTDDSEGIASATLAELYAQQGLVEQAVTTLELVLARDPNNVQVQARLNELRS